MALCLVSRQYSSYGVLGCSASLHSLTLRTNTPAPYPNEAHVVLDVGIGRVAHKRYNWTKLSTHTKCHHGYGRG